MQWLVWRHGPAEIIKEFISSVKKYLWRAFAAGFQFLPFHAFDYNCPPVQYLALMQSNPYAQLLQSCKVFLLDFLHMTTYIWSPSHKLIVPCIWLGLPTSAIFVPDGGQPTGGIVADGQPMVTG